MSGFFSKLFGGKKKDSGSSDIETLVGKTIDGLIEKGQFDLSYVIRLDTENADEPKLTVEFKGKDEALLKDKEGQMIDSLQLFIKRVIQHNFPEDRTNVQIDCNGFIEESAQALVDLAEKLKGVALEKGKSVYFRALPPKDRKVIHQYLAEDSRVKSRSIGEGLYKKIKIYPVKSREGATEENVAE